MPADSHLDREHTRGWVNAWSHGVKADGVHPDSQALQDAINAGPAGGGPVLLPPGRIILDRKVTLQKNTALLGWNLSSIDALSVQTYHTVVDATGILNDRAFLGPGNGVGVRYAGFALLGPLAPSGSGSIGLHSGGFTSGFAMEKMYIEGFYTGAQMDAVQGGLIQGVILNKQYNCGLDVIGGGKLQIISSLLANAAGNGASSANLRVRGGAVDVLFQTPLVDEAFGVGGSSVLLLDCDKVKLDGMRIFLTSGGYGVRLGDGANNPTNVSLVDVRIEPFAVDRVPTQTLEIRGTGHRFVNVSTDPNGGGDVNDLSADSIYFNLNGKYRVPNLAGANPGAGTKQLWYDPADANRVKFSA